MSIAKTYKIELTFSDLDKFQVPQRVIKKTRRGGNEKGEDKIGKNVNIGETRLEQWNAPLSRKSEVCKAFL